MKEKQNRHRKKKESNRVRDIYLSVTPSQDTSTKREMEISIVLVLDELMNL